MAILTQSGGSGLKIDEVCPEGTYVAVIGRIHDQFGVQRPKFDNPAEMETIDVTRFYFGVVTQEGTPYRVQTYEYKISGSPKSNLYKLLQSILGHNPQMGWDYCSLVGKGCVIEVRHKASRDGSRVYPNIVSVRPAKDGLSDYTSYIPAIDLFDWGTEEAQQDEQPAAPQAPAQRIPVVPIPKPAAPAVKAPVAPAPRPAAAPQQLGMHIPRATVTVTESSPGNVPF